VKGGEKNKRNGETEKAASNIRQRRIGIWRNGIGEAKRQQRRNT